MRFADYPILLRLPLTQASYRPQWTRRTIQGGFILLTGICLLALLNYAWYLPSEHTASNLEEPSETPSQAVYLPFRPVQRVVSSALKPTLPLQADCLDAHFERGELCSSANLPPLDIIWTWVNGSDILLQDAKTRIEESFSPDDPYRPSRSWRTVRQFRDHDELRHSMRSALANFRPYVRNFHLLASDFYVHVSPNGTIANPPWRLGQVPQWLNVRGSRQEWVDGRVRLIIMHHADFFQPYNDTVFNSYSIESQLGHLTNVTENFVYMNDDFFFLRPLTPRSFYTSPYGLVLRLQSDLLVSPSPYGNNVRGEWRNLAVSNALLGTRFGVRSRPYVAHLAKGASLAILHEIDEIWSAQVVQAATHPFRETARGDGDLSMMFMMVHFTIERWREAILWSWAVARNGGLDDAWGQEEADIAWEELGGDISTHEDIPVRAAYRDSLDPERVTGNLRASGYTEDDPTAYVFTSQDGYPYVNFIDKAKNQWPKYSRDVRERDLPRCKISYTECFTNQGTWLGQASEVFKHIAFRRPKCGDCVIVALLSTSGNSGLSAFLPSHGRVLSPSAGSEVPHLPLVERWEDGSFALKDVMASSPGGSVREWTLQLLQRYRFVIAETASHFAMLSGPSDMRALIRNLQREPSIALLCVNDDIAIGHEQVSEQLAKWELEQWPQPAAWEIQ